MHRRERHQIRYASSVRPCPLLYVSNSCVNMPTCVRRWDSGGGTKQVRYRTGQCSADAPDTISLSLQEHGVCMEPRNHVDDDGFSVLVVLALGLQFCHGRWSVKSSSPTCWMSMDNGEGLRSLVWAACLCWRDELYMQVW